MYEFELQELEEATNGFSSSRLIGKGSHGSVYKAILKDGNHLAVKKQSLALQKLHDNTKLYNESLILSAIPPNPYVIKFLGVSHDSSDNKIIVTEYMANGTLHQLLHSSATPPSWRKRVEIALRVAKGLCCLHDSNPSIVHRDIKSANLLFDQNWNVKLADFGLAMQLHGEIEAKLPAGTIGYIDPSYTTPDKVSTKIDVFSYGVVLLELISGRKAIDMSKSPPSIIEWALPLIKKGRNLEVCDKRVCFSLYILRQLIGLAARCLSSDESIRPSMFEVVEDLENLIIEPIHDQFPWSMNYIRDMVGWMMRRKKSRFSGKCRVIETSGACVEDNDRECGVACNNISKGRLLVREILADITLK